MIHIRREGEAIRQGFNFYPFDDEGSFGCQMLFWKLRVELRSEEHTSELQSH